MEKPWIINWKGIVEKVRDQSQLLYLRLAELVSGAYIKCPNCQYCIDCSKVPIVWPKVPVGVKFVLSDSELLLHLEEKSNQPDSVSSAHNKEFIPTIEDPDGICYTHPKNLPDGSSSYFFYRISNAYGRGHRKRRKVDVDYTVSNDTKLRWHKTGTSKEVCDENGVKKGWKKILVLYTGSKKGRDSKTNWVMHQYHLGVNEAEKNGQLVVSKVFYQLASKQVDKSEMDISVVEHDASIKIDPRTPKIDPPQPRHPNNSPCETEQYNSPCLLDQGGAESSTSNFGVKDEDKYLAWYAGSSEILEDTAQPDMGEPSVTGMHIVSESASGLGFQTFLDKGKAPLVLTQVLETGGWPEYLVRQKRLRIKRPANTGTYPEQRGYWKLSSETDA
ncbi:hypothetical protein EJB05_39118 [Eragrostis curvula]|uniref:NAC domain-containing protein n=1 Tax=Eragrostis curvula TaxID=38414 RepID=A0A5J9TXN5_9POAL|nr:hypothetical protein EJB05_39118 [Eragrostis curvula]